MHIIFRLLFSVSVASQVDEAFFFESIMRGHHIYVQCGLRLFEGNYYFASLFAKCGINLRVATKQAQKEVV